MGTVSKKIGLIGVLIAAMVFGGCSSSTPTSTSSVTLYWWRPMDDTGAQTLQSIVDSFNQSNPSIKIQIVLKDPRTYAQDANDAMAAHATEADSPDILAVRAEDMTSYAPKLYPAPDNAYDALTTKSQKTGQTTTQYVQKLFVPAAAKAVTINDQSGAAKVYGLPMAVDELALYKNTNLLQKAVDNLRSTNQVTKNLSPDELKSLQTKMQATVKTWQDLADITPYLTIKSGNDISQSAIALGTSTNVERSYDILSSIMMQNGTQMTTSSLDSASFNLQQAGAAQSSNPGKDALDFYLRFANPSDPLYTWNNSMPNSVDAFENGQAAMLIHFASAYRYIVNDAPAIKSSIQVDPLPQVSDPASPTSQGSLKTMANMLVETVPSARGDAARQKAAWTFVHYATTKQGAAPYLSAMKLPSALNDGSDHGQFQAFNDQKKLGDLWYKGNSALKINEIFINMINQAATGEKSSKDALDSAAAQVTGFLQTSTWKWSVTGSNLNVSNVGSK